MGSTLFYDSKKKQDVPTLSFVHYGRVSARRAVATGDAAVGGAADKRDTSQHALHAAGVLASSGSTVTWIQHDLSGWVVALTGSWNTNILTHVNTLQLHLSTFYLLLLIYFSQHNLKALSTYQMYKNETMGVKTSFASHPAHWRCRAREHCRR